MREKTSSSELSPEGQTKIDAVDSYLEEMIRQGRPIEALITTRRLGEIASDRAKEAARLATEGSWSWTDVGQALGMTKQAAHEKLRARVRGEIDKGLSKLERAEKAGHAKIAGRAMRRRERLDQDSPALAGGWGSTTADRRVGTASTQQAQPGRGEGTGRACGSRAVGPGEARPQELSCWARKLRNLSHAAPSLIMSA